MPCGFSGFGEPEEGDPGASTGGAPGTRATDERPSGPEDHGRPKAATRARTRTAAARTPSPCPYRRAWADRSAGIREARRSTGPDCPGPEPVAGVRAGTGVASGAVPGDGTAFPPGGPDRPDRAPGGVAGPSSDSASATPASAPCSASATPCRSRRSPSARSHRRCSASRSSAGAPHSRASRSTGANSAGTVRPVQYRCSVEPLTPMRRASDAYVRPDPSRSALSRSASTARAAPSASPDTLVLPCRCSRAFQPSGNTHVTGGGTVPARPEAVSRLSGSGAAAQAGARSTPPPSGPHGGSVRLGATPYVRANGRTVRTT